MITKKDLVIVVLATFCLSATVFTVIPTRSQNGKYDPWLDINTDGTINIIDLANTARAFGSSGDPTRMVIVMNSHYEWYSNETVGPRRGWGFLNETAGYRQVSIRMTSYAALNVVVIFGIMANNTQYITSQDLFDVQKDETVYKTYDVRGPSLQVVFFNPSSTEDASVFVAVYVTT